MYELSKVDAPQAVTAGQLGAVHVSGAETGDGCRSAPLAPNR